MTSLLEVRNLAVSYGQAIALNGVSLTVPTNGLMAVVGANGAGKTSLVRAISGMLTPQTGQILFDGTDITAHNSTQTCELGIGQVAEGRQIFPSLTVEENLHLGAALKRARNKRLQNFARVFAMFPRLAERRAQRAGTLSGGEQQMLAIGRCLMGEPRLIMFDEPSLGLSPIMVELIFDTIVELKNAGMTILLIEQNVAESLEIAETAAVLENGSLVLSGPARDIAADDRVKSAYLGI
jgi:branched-chain amino acid transport system ATP-binding protein